MSHDDENQDLHIQDVEDHFDCDNGFTYTNETNIVLMLPKTAQTCNSRRTMRTADLQQMALRSILEIKV